MSVTWLWLPQQSAHRSNVQDLATVCLSVCLSAVSERFASSIADEKLNFPVNFQQNCHFTRWVPEIIFWEQGISQRWSLISIFHRERTSKAKAALQLFLLSHFPYPPHPSLIPSVSSWTFPSLFLLFLLSLLPLGSCSVIFSPDIS